MALPRRGLGLFCVFVAVSTVLGVIQSHPGVGGSGLRRVVGGGRCLPASDPSQAAEPKEPPGPQPLVRKEWLIAMAIMFVSLMVTVIMFGGHPA